MQMGLLLLTLLTTLLVVSEAAQVQFTIENYTEKSQFTVGSVIALQGRAKLPAIVDQFIVKDGENESLVSTVNFEPVMLTSKYRSIFNYAIEEKFKETTFLSISVSAYDTHRSNYIHTDVFQLIIENDMNLIPVIGLTSPASVVYPGAYVPIYAVATSNFGGKVSLIGISVTTYDSQGKILLDEIIPEEKVELSQSPRLASLYRISDNLRGIPIITLTPIVSSKIKVKKSSFTIQIMQSPFPHIGYMCNKDHLPISIGDSVELSLKSSWPVVVNQLHIEDSSNPELFSDVRIDEILVANNVLVHLNSFVLNEIFTNSSAILITASFNGNTYEEYFKICLEVTKRQPESELQTIDDNADLSRLEDSESNIPRFTHHDSVELLRIENELSIPSGRRRFRRSKKGKNANSSAKSLEKIPDELPKPSSVESYFNQDQFEVPDFFKSIPNLNEIVKEFPDSSYLNYKTKVKIDPIPQSFEFPSIEQNLFEAHLHFAGVDVGDLLTAPDDYLDDSRFGNTPADITHESPFLTYRERKEILSEAINYPPTPFVNPIITGSNNEPEVNPEEDLIQFDDQICLDSYGNTSLEVNTTESNEIPNLEEIKSNEIPAPEEISSTNQSFSLLSPIADTNTTDSDILHITLSPGSNTQGESEVFAVFDEDGFDSSLLFDNSILSLNTRDCFVSENHRAQTKAIESEPNIDYDISTLFEETFTTGNNEITFTTGNNEITFTTDNNEITFTTDKNEITSTTGNNEITSTTDNNEITSTTDNNEIASTQTTALPTTEPLLVEEEEGFLDLSFLFDEIGEIMDINPNDYQIQTENNVQSNDIPLNTPTQSIEQDQLNSATPLSAPVEGENKFFLEISTSKAAYGCPFIISCFNPTKYQFSLTKITVRSDDGMLINFVIEPPYVIDSNDSREIHSFLLSDPFSDSRRISIEMFNPNNMVINLPYEIELEQENALTLSTNTLNIHVGERFVVFASSRHCAAEVTSIKFYADDGTHSEFYFDSSITVNNQETFVGKFTLAEKFHLLTTVKIVVFNHSKAICKPIEMKITKPVINVDYCETGIEIGTEFKLLLSSQNHILIHDITIRCDDSSVAPLRMSLSPPLFTKNEQEKEVGVLLNESFLTCKKVFVNFQFMNRNYLERPVEIVREVGKILLDVEFNSIGNVNASSEYLVAIYATAQGTSPVKVDQVKLFYWDNNSAILNVNPVIENEIFRNGARELLCFIDIQKLMPELENCIQLRAYFGGASVSDSIVIPLSNVEQSNENYNEKLNNNLIQEEPQNQIANSGQSFDNLSQLFDENSDQLFENSGQPFGELIHSIDHLDIQPSSVANSPLTDLFVFKVKKKSEKLKPNEKIEFFLSLNGNKIIASLSKITITANWNNKSNESAIIFESTNKEFILSCEDENQTIPLFTWTVPTSTQLPSKQVKFAINCTGELYDERGNFSTNINTCNSTEELISTSHLAVVIGRTRRDPSPYPRHSTVAKRFSNIQQDKIPKKKFKFHK